MSGAERKRLHREREAKGLRVYSAVLNEEKTEELLWRFGVASVGELIELLLRLDALLAARGGRGLGKLLGSLADELMNGDRRLQPLGHVSA